MLTFFSLFLLTEFSTFYLQQLNTEWSRLNINFFLFTPPLNWSWKAPLFSPPLISSIFSRDFLQPSNKHHLSYLCVLTFFLVSTELEFPNAYQVRVSPVWVSASGRRQCLSPSMLSERRLKNSVRDISPSSCREQCIAAKNTFFESTLTGSINCVSNLLKQTFL